jgi:hypothetical protein
VAVDVKLHGAPRRFFSATFSAFQVVDQVVRIFQADGQADQPWVMLASASSAMRKWWCWPVNHQARQSPTLARVAEHLSASTRPCPCARLPSSQS